MYQEHLLHLSRDTAHRRPPAADSRRAERRNPACGDEIELAVTADDGTLQISYTAQACAVTLASAAALARGISGCSLPLARDRLREAQDFFARSAPWSADWGDPDLPALGEFRAFPMRMACVRLPWEALAAIIAAV